MTMSCRTEGRKAGKPFPGGMGVKPEAFCGRVESRRQNGTRFPVRVFSPGPDSAPGEIPGNARPEENRGAFGGAGGLGVPGPWTGGRPEGATFAPCGHRLSPQAGGPAAVRRSLPRRPKPSRNFIPAGDARRRRVTAHPRPARTRPNGSPSPFTHPAAYRTRPGRVLRIRKNHRNAVEPCLVLQDGVLRLSPGSGTWRGSFPRSRPEKPGRARSSPRSPPLVIPLMIPLVMPLMALLGHEAAAPPPASQPQRDPSPGPIRPPDGTPGRPEKPGRARSPSTLPTLSDTTNDTISDTTNGTARP
jgi:hypothetical protein